MTRILTILLSTTLLLGCGTPHHAPRSIDTQLTIWRVVPNKTIAEYSLAAELNRQLHAQLRANNGENR